MKYYNTFKTELIESKLRNKHLQARQNLTLITALVFFLLSNKDIELSGK